MLCPFSSLLRVLEESIIFRRANEVGGALRLKPEKTPDFCRIPAGASVGSVCTGAGTIVHAYK